jgi:hypothetical protein
MESIATVLRPFFLWLLQTTLAASVVIVFILAFQKLLGRKLGPRWGHALWLVLVARLLLPGVLPGQVDLLNLVTPGNSQIREQPPAEAPAQNIAVPTVPGPGAAEPGHGSTAEPAPAGLKKAIPDTRMELRRQDEDRSRSLRYRDLSLLEQSPALADRQAGAAAARPANPRTFRGLQGRNAGQYDHRARSERPDKDPGPIWFRPAPSPASGEDHRGVQS